ATPTELLAAHKPHAGELVVGWMTTSESSLLYVFFFSLIVLYLIYTVKGKNQFASEIREASAVIVNGFSMTVAGSIRTKTTIQDRKS
ncbi:hypothetical protein VN97_g4592, partial [Penicillium thymicola]